MPLYSPFLTADLNKFNYLFSFTFSHEQMKLSQDQDNNVGLKEKIHQYVTQAQIHPNPNPSIYSYYLHGPLTRWKYQYCTSSYQPLGSDLLDLTFAVLYIDYTESCCCKREYCLSNSPQ